MKLPILKSKGPWKKGKKYRGITVPKKTGNKNTIAYKVNPLLSTLTPEQLIENKKKFMTQIDHNTKVLETRDSDNLLYESSLQKLENLKQLVSEIDEIIERKKYNYEEISDKLETEKKEYTSNIKTNLKTNKDFVSFFDKNEEVKIKSTNIWKFLKDNFSIEGSAHDVLEGKSTATSKYNNKKYTINYERKPDFFKIKLTEV